MTGHRSQLLADCGTPFVVEGRSIGIGDLVLEKCPYGRFGKVVDILGDFGSTVVVKLIIGGVGQCRFRRVDDLKFISEKETAHIYLSAQGARTLGYRDPLD